MLTYDSKFNKLSAKLLIHLSWDRKHLKEAMHEEKLCIESLRSIVTIFSQNYFNDL